jgi:hypothetical protein
MTDKKPFQQACEEIVTALQTANMDGAHGLVLKSHHDYWWRKTLSAIQELEEEKAFWLSGEGRKFALGQRVRKIKGSSWQGRVVGVYSTELTPVGYAVESEREPGSVQIYPEAALEAVQ